MTNEVEKEIIERLTRIETKQDNIFCDIRKLDDRVNRAESKLGEHDYYIRLLSKGSSIWIDIIKSGIGVLIGAIIISIYKGCGGGV